MAKAIERQQFVRAWRLAKFAGHQWSQVPWEDLLTLTNKGVREPLDREQFRGHFDGLSARQWADLARALTFLYTHPGPAGWGIVAPSTDDKGNLVIRIGAGVEAIFSPDRYSISYRNPHRGVEIAVLMPFQRVGISGPVAPRDWARLARLVREAEGLDLISGVVPPEVRGSREYQEYLLSRNAGHLLAGPPPQEEVGV